NMAREIHVVDALDHVYAHGSKIAATKGAMSAYNLVSRIWIGQEAATYHHTSTSTRLQRASIATEPHTSLPPRLHACSPPPDLRTSISPSPQHASRLLELHTSMHQVRLGYGAYTKEDVYLPSGQAICTVDSC